MDVVEGCACWCGEGFLCVKRGVMFGGKRRSYYVLLGRIYLFNIKFLYGSCYIFTRFVIGFHCKITEHHLDDFLSGISSHFFMLRLFYRTRDMHA